MVLIPNFISTSLTYKSPNNQKMSNINRFTIQMLLKVKKIYPKSLNSTNRFNMFLNVSYKIMFPKLKRTRVNL